MAMTVREFEQFKKIVAQAAATDNDAECATFFRRATAMLSRHGHDWTAALNRVIRVVDFGEVEAPPGTVAPPPQPQVNGRGHGRHGTGHQLDTGRYDGIERDLELAIDDATGSFLETLESIRSQWEDDARLSDRQLEVVREAAERAANRYPGGRIR